MSKRTPGVLTGFLGGFDLSLHRGEYMDDPTKPPDGTQLCKIAGQVCKEYSTQ